jgi:hypothetical protein
VRRLPDELLVLGPDDPAPTVVTGPAADVWELVERPIDFETAAATLAEHYATDAVVVERDLEPVWAHLLALEAIGPA